MRQRTATASFPGVGQQRRRAKTRRAADIPAAEERRTTLVVASWGVTGVCAYLGFTALQPLPTTGVIALIVVAMMATNTIIGKINPERVVAPIFAVGVAVFYSGLLLAAWHLGGQGSVPLLVVTIALLDLALVGLSLAELAAVSLAMFFAYAVIV